MPDHKPITTIKDVPRAYILTWVPEDFDPERGDTIEGTCMEVGTAELRSKGYRRGSTLYKRAKEILEHHGFNPDEDAFDTLMEFVDEVVNYDRFLEVSEEGEPSELHIQLTDWFGQLRDLVEEGQPPESWLSRARSVLDTLRSSEAVFHFRSDDGDGTEECIFCGVVNLVEDNVAVHAAICPVAMADALMVAWEHGGKGGTERPH